MMKAVIFDIDGTLLDSVDLHAKAWQEAFRHFGREIPLDDIRRQIGKGGDQLLPVFLNEADRERFGKDLETFRGGLFKCEYLNQIKAFPGVRDLFEKLIETGYKIALASSAKGDEIEAYKKIANITDLIHEEASKDDAQRSKPHPDIFQAALGKLGLEASECIAVGDSPYDAEAAGKLNLKTIGVLSGGFPAADLKNAGCLRIYRDAADLLAHVDEAFAGKNPDQEPETPVKAQ